MNIVNTIKNPYVLLGLSLIIIIISRFVFKIDYMNSSKIIYRHISIFTNSRNGKLLLVPFFTYTIIPLIIAFGVNGIKVIDEDMINIVTVILSILTSMLFTLLVMVIDMKNKIELRTSSNSSQVNIMKRLIKETYYSVMFEILISVALLIVSFIYLFTQKVNTVISTLIYYLLFLLLFNLLIVLKRIFNIIEEDLNN